MQLLSISWTAKEELQEVWQKQTTDDFLAFSSLKSGRAICVILLVGHVAGIVLKPLLCLVYVIVGVAYTLLSKLFQAERFQDEPDEFREELRYWASALINVFIGPVCQIVKLMRAAYGIIFPHTFVEHSYDALIMDLDFCCTELAKHAQAVGSSNELVAKLQSGEPFITAKLQNCSTAEYFQYLALFKRDLAVILDIFNRKDFPSAKKLSLLNLLEPHEEDTIFVETGINACPSGFGRLLAQIRSSIDSPHEHDQVIPWLLSLYAIEIINLMVAKAAAAEPPHSPWVSIIRADHFDNMHSAHGLITILGAKIGISTKDIRIACKDEFRTKFTSHEFNALLEGFQEVAKDEPFDQFLLSRINPDEQGGPGLKEFRQHVINTLAEKATEKELESCKQLIVETMGVTEYLADEPFTYVRFRYYSHPEDVKGTDLNVKALKDFWKFSQNYHPILWWEQI